MISFKDIAYTFWGEMDQNPTHEHFTIVNI